MTLKSRHSKMRQVIGLALFILAISSLLSFAQQLTGTLTGTTMDTSGAVVANAKVTMRNELNNDIRTTVSNGSGYFTITAILPGTYTVTVEATGFKQWKQSGIVFNQGDTRTLPQIALQVGAVTETVEISAAALTVPTDSGEISHSIPQKMIEAFPLGNRDAGELIKIMPGMALSNGSNQGSSFSTKLVSSASGPVGSYSANGTQPSGAMAFMLDGTNLVDPGNNGGQMANINQDMVQEVKVLMSDYSAEYAKGPVIFQAFSKSGTSNYHGVGYVYARNSALNSLDAYTKSQLQPGQSATVPDESYYYMGGNVGGPLPYLSRGQHKLFFWGGYEYMRQHPAGSVVNYNVPTTEQLAGDFTNTTLNGIPGSTDVGGQTLASKLQSVWPQAYNNIGKHLPTGCGATATSLPTACWDPNGPAWASLLPTQANPRGGAFITPGAENGWNNYQFITTSPQNRWEATGKVDYAIGDNTKLTGSYSRQIEKLEHPIGIWWTPPWTLPYPSNVVQNLTSQLFLVNATHVFSPTTTNEAVFTYTRFNTPNTAADPSAVSRSALGMNIPGLFGQQIDQIPNIQGPWGGAFPDIGNMNLTGGFAANKRAPAVYDNLTHVIGTHTLKFGAYWDTTTNMQPSSGWAGGANGNFNLGGDFGTDNSVADFLLGRANYTQPSLDVINTIKSHMIAAYAQDSFKANRQLTVNYGMRFTHNGQWFSGGNGMAVWDPASYTNDPVPNTGLLWHAIDSKIPQSGWTSPFVYFEPRVGFAYDILGNGKTVLRGGFASFRYNVSVNDVGGPASLAQGAFTANVNNLQGYNDPALANYTPPAGGGSANGSTITVFQRGDNRTPYTNDWNISIAQALPWQSVFEISYIGNKSYNLLLNGGNGKISDANSNFPGSYWSANPKKTINGQQAFLSPSGVSCQKARQLEDADPWEPDGSAWLGCTGTGPNGVAVQQNYNASFSENDYRRLTNYNDIYVLTHGGYANYNSLQMSWKKQSGPINYLLNYSFSKVLGIRDGNTNQAGSTGAVVDPFNLRNNYGPLAYDHTHIVNLTYVWSLPKFVHGNRVLEAAVNGWQLSGYTTFQSGAPLQANNTLNFTFASGLTAPRYGLEGSAFQLPDNTVALPNGLKSTAVNQGTFYGTSQNGGGYAAMLPLVTCDPRKDKPKDALFNPDCFTTPAFGQLGTFNWPYIKLPAYWNSDLGLYKTFKITESKSVKLQIQAANFLNHSLRQFNLAGNSDSTINLQQNSTTLIPYTEVVNLPANFEFGTNKNVTYDPAVYTIQRRSCDWIGASLAGDNCSVDIHAISPTNTNTTMTGRPHFATGQRVITVSAKFYF